MTEIEIKNEISRLHGLATQIEDAIFGKQREARKLDNLLDKVEEKIKSLNEQFDPPKLEPR